MPQNPRQRHAAAVSAMQATIADGVRRCHDLDLRADISFISGEPVAYSLTPIAETALDGDSQQDDVNWCAPAPLAPAIIQSTREDCA